jgi:acyl dehydratase
MSHSLTVGARASITRSYTAEDIGAFLGLAACDAAPAGGVPEPLIGALFSYLLGVELPGFGTNYLKQEMTFEAPARPGRALTATVEVTRLRPEKHLADLATICTDADGTVICRGRALVLVKDVGA